jgi:hypothetical protein
MELDWILNYDENGEPLPWRKRIHINPKTWKVVKSYPIIGPQEEIKVEHSNNMTWDMT